MEAAFAIAKEDGNGVVVEVGGDDVGVAIVVEVCGAETLVGAAAGGEEVAGRDEAAGAVAEKELDLVVAPAVGNGVELAVGIEIGGDDSVGMGVGVDVDGGTGGEVEAAVAVAEEDAEVRRLVIGDDEVEVAVVVHVGDSDVVGEVSGGEGRVWRGMEGAMAVAEQDGDSAIVLIVGPRVGDEDVGIGVMVDVGDGDPARTRAGGDSGLAEARSLGGDGRGEEQQCDKGAGTHRATEGSGFYTAQTTA